MEYKRPLESIPDDELLHQLAEILRQSRRVEGDLVAHIAEVDERRLYAREASSSMFTYCTDVLHLSGAEAYLRIAAARASRKHPVILEMLGDGRLHLTGIAMLAPYLTPENRDTLLERATHRSKHQIEELISEMAPRPDVGAVVRKLPTGKTPAPLARPGGAGSDRVRTLARDLRPDAAEARTLELRPDGVGPMGGTLAAMIAARPTVIQPLAPGRYKVQFTASAQLKDKLERLRALMRSKVPDGDLAMIIEEAVTEKLERLEARRYAKARNPRRDLTQTNVSASSRYIPAAVRRAVSQRDGQRCRYVDSQGRRCPDRSRLEYHHRFPHALGVDHSPKNVFLMCQTHNAYLAERDYDKEQMARHRSSGKSRGLQATASGRPPAPSPPPPTFGGPPAPCP